MSGILSKGRHASSKDNRIPRIRKHVHPHGHWPTSVLYTYMSVQTLFHRVGEEYDLNMCTDFDDFFHIYLNYQYEFSHERL